LGGRVKPGHDGGGWIEKSLHHPSPQGEGSIVRQRLAPSSPRPSGEKVRVSGAQGRMGSHRRHSRVGGKQYRQPPSPGTSAPPPSSPGLTRGPNRPRSGWRGRLGGRVKPGHDGRGGGLKEPPPHPSPQGEGRTCERASPHRPLAPLGRGSGAPRGGGVPPVIPASAGIQFSASGVRCPPFEHSSPGLLAANRSAGAICPADRLGVHWTFAWAALRPSAHSATGVLRRQRSTGPLHRRLSAVRA
jgi:hypothetical protein